jgi:hypothetical protein
MKLEDMDDAIAKRDPDEIQKTGVDQFTQQLTTYLDHLKLPSTGVLVPAEERRKVIKLLPDVVGLLSEDARNSAYYVSKFVAACGVGLFDAALNFLWDETVADLRKKVARFDLEYFYDSLFTDPDRRKEFSTEEHLVNLDDWKLIRGCRNIGILSEIGYRHLDYVRDMRNWASAAHPNQVELSGLQLTTWLETCVKEVLAKEPSAPAIEVKTLLTNIRTQTLAATDVAPIATRVQALPAEIANSLLRALAGMFADTQLAATAKNNIRLIAPAVWGQALDQARQEVGLKYSRFAANADVQRRDALRELLTLVGGLAFLPPDALALELSEKIQAVEAAHLGFNNFYNEPLPARTLASFVPANGAIPGVIRAEYVRVLTLAHIGNPYGTSEAADAHYVKLIEMFGESEINEFVRLIEDRTIISRLDYARPAARFVQMARDLRARTAAPAIQAALDLIIAATAAQLPKLGRTNAIKTAIQQMPIPDRR